MTVKSSIYGTQDWTEIARLYVRRHTMAGPHLKEALRNQGIHKTHVLVHVLQRSVRSSDSRQDRVEATCNAKKGHHHEHMPVSWWRLGGMQQSPFYLLAHIKS